MVFIDLDYNDAASSDADTEFSPLEYVGDIAGSNIMY